MNQPIYLNCTNYRRAEPLKAHIGNDPIAASVADIILYKWQNSQITFKGGKACCPTLDDISRAVGVSVKTVTRKIEKLVKLGLISKTLGRWVNGATRLYLKVTDLFVGLITGEIKKDQKEIKKSQKDQCSSDLDNLSKSTKTNCPSPINKEKERKEKKEKNNNPMVVSEVPKESSNTTSNATVTVNFQQVEKEVTVHCKDKFVIGEKLTRQQCAIINGMVNNLIKEGVKITNPKELKAQVAFKAEQKNMQSGGNNLKHQINAAAKLIRSSKWTTPFGFYKYSEVGREIAQKREKAERNAKESKYESFAPNLPDHLKDLLTLNLRGVGQGDNTASVDGKCINANTRQEKPSVFDSKKADMGGQLATENEATGATNLTQGGPMDLSRSELISEKSSSSVGITKAQSRVDVLNESIARCQDKMSAVTGKTKDALTGVIDRLKEEISIINLSNIEGKNR